MKEIMWISLVSDFHTQEYDFCGVHVTKKLAMKDLRENNYSYKEKEDIWINNTSRTYIVLFKTNINKFDKFEYLKYRASEKKDQV